MIARGFKSVIWVGAVGAAALACYMVSLQVATERSELEKVERQIIAAKQEIRSLQTELGTRGRLSQLEHWNAEVLALSAPTTGQFLQNEFTLARFEQRTPTVAEQTATVRMASADTAPAAPAPAAEAPRIVNAVAAPAPAAQPPLVRRASLDTIPAAAPPASKAVAPVEPKAKTETKTAKAGKPAAGGAPKPRLGGSLAAELGAAARAEKDEGSGGN